MKLMEYVRPGAIVTRGYAERLLKGITPECFARYPVVNGVQVTIKHPAFVFGHLALYPALIAEMTGISNKGMEIPKNYPDLFKMGVPCQDDPNDSAPWVHFDLYPPRPPAVAPRSGQWMASVYGTWSGLGVLGKQGKTSLTQVFARNGAHAPLISGQKRSTFDECPAQPFWQKNAQALFCITSLLPRHLLDLLVLKENLLDIG